MADERIVQIRGFADRDLKDPAHPESAINRRIAITVRFADEPASAADSTAAPGRASAPADSLVPGRTT